jgi:hypothetical protein
MNTELAAQIPEDEKLGQLLLISAWSLKGP